MEYNARFWGVRGSISAPGAATLSVGGNTTCVEIAFGGEQIVIDAGTGFRALGARLGVEPITATILFSHLHWDHIQGLPFFAPLFHPGTEITLIGPAGLQEVLAGQMSRPTFPVDMDVFAARLRFVVVEPGEQLSVGDVRVATAALNHPGGAIAYRLDHGGKALVHACDHEQGAATSDDGLVALARGADLLVCDAQYLPEEYPAKRGWGHSTYEQAVALARAAGVDTLALTHHEPTRSDAEMAWIETRAQRLMPEAWVAREGMVVHLEGEGVRVSGSLAQAAGAQVVARPPAPSRDWQV